MMDEKEQKIETSTEQLIFAKVMETGMYIGLAALFVTFTLYVFGVIKPHLTISDVPAYWNLSVEEYLLQANISTGWSWVGRLGYGDFINFIGVAILAGVTIVCYIAIVPAFIKDKDYVYAALSVAEIIVLVLAASGLLTAGH